MNHLTIATVRFRFEPGDTLPANPDKSQNYTLDYGNIKSGILRPEFDNKEHYASIQGNLVLDDIRNVKRKLTYEFTIDELTPEAIELHYGKATTLLPGHIQAGYGWVAMDQEGDEQFLVHHSFHCGIWVEGDLTLNGEDYTEWKLKVAVFLSQPGKYITTRTHKTNTINAKK